MRIKNSRNIEYQKILIIGAADIERSFLLIPAIRLIKDKNKNARIDITAGIDAEILNEIGWFEKIIQIGKPNILKTIRCIQSERYDIVISFYPSLLPFITRTKKRIIFFKRTVFADRFFTHESVNVLKTIEPIFGKPQEIGLYFPVNETDKDRVKEFCKTNNITASSPLVAIHTGDINSPRWEEEKYSLVCDSIIEEYNAKILLFGIPKDPFIKKIISSTKSPDNIFDMSGVSNLKTIAAFLSRANLAITRDGIFLYLACAMKTPVVSIFGPGNPYRYGPIGVRYVIIHSNMDCFPCNKNRRCSKNHICINTINPQQVIEASRLILDEGNQLFLFE